MRRFYVAFGAFGFAMDYVAHYLQAITAQLPDPALVTLKLVTGWNDAFLAGGQWLGFSIGVGAHSLFLFAFVLLAVRGR